jgi:hypothetical protein
LEPSRPISLHRDAWGRLVLNNGLGGAAVAVVAVRAFPFSCPRQGVALCDLEGHEILWLESLDALSAEVRQVVEEELARREFVPVIRRICDIKPRIEPSEWEVETDRGRARFLLHSADDVRRLDERRAMVIDAHGIRYLINDTEDLDSESRHLLERYL